MKIWALYLFYVVNNLLIADAEEFNFKYFSTKTPYEWVRPKLKHLEEDDLYNVEKNGLTCSAVHATAIVRHGARFPGFSDVKKIVDIHSRLKIVLPPEKSGDLGKWENRFPQNDEKHLSFVGEKEQLHLGHRVGKRLKSLFIDEEPNLFRYVVSSKARTKASAQSFYEGFTKSITADIEDDFTPELNDHFLRFHENCGNYISMVDKNRTALAEYEKFKNGEKMQNILQKITSKLSISPNVLSTDDLRTMYLICGYEMALYEGSPWCGLFEEEDMRILEYLGDLKHYYKNGHGYEINHRQACPLLTDIFETMDDALNSLDVTSEEEDEEEYLVGNFYFGHAESVGPIMTALGLFNDSVPLKADNFDTQADRLFRTSQILPFSSNLMFVMYECEPSGIAYVDGDVTETGDIEYYLKLLVNEKPHLIPGCSEELCQYKAVREKYSSAINTCDFQKICGLKSEIHKDEL